MEALLLLCDARSTIIHLLIRIDELSLMGIREWDLLGILAFALARMMEAGGERDEGDDEKDTVVRPE